MVLKTTVGLIALHAGDGSTVYPHAQFDVLLDDTLRRRDKVIGLWNTLIQPAIDEGIISEWTATGFLLQRSKEKQSEAERIAKDETQIHRVGEQIAKAIAGFRQ